VQQGLEVLHIPAGSKQKGYTIKKGDTLSQIAKKQGITLKAIKEANKGIKDLNKIQAGQKIKLPSKPKSKDPYAGMTKSEMKKLAVDKKLLGGVALRKLMKSKTKTKTKTPVKKKLGGGMVKKKMAGGMVKKKILGGAVKMGRMVKKKMDDNKRKKRVKALKSKTKGK
jgi:LysM repeat protein